MNSILIITSLLIIFSIFSHALIKLGIGISNNPDKTGNDSNLLIVFYVQIMPDDFVMQLHRF